MTPKLFSADSERLERGDGWRPARLYVERDSAELCRAECWTRPVKLRFDWCAGRAIGASVVGKTNA